MHLQQALTCSVVGTGHASWILLPLPLPDGLEVQVDWRYLVFMVRL